MLVDAAKYGDVEIPVFCYEPKLGQPVGACRMCLVEIEGIPKLQTGCSTPVRDGMVVYTQTERVKEAQRGDRRVPAHQPPARLPRLRQGRRVPAAGHHHRLGPRPLALHRAQAPLRQAARAVAAHRDRPRALHPLLPLRALQPGDLRGLPARPAGARRPHVRRDVRRPPVRRAVQRQHHRAVPGRRADLAAVPLPRAAVGHRGLRLGLHALPGAVQRRVHGPRRARPARALARPRRRRRRLAVRQGPLRLPVRARRRAGHAAARARATELEPASWDRALEAAATALARRAPGPRALAGGETTNEEGFLLAHLMRDGLGSSHLDSRPGGTLPRDCTPRCTPPACRRRSPTSSSPTPSSCSTASRSTTRRSRPAHPQGRAPQRRQARRRQRPAVLAGPERHRRALRARRRRGVCRRAERRAGRRQGSLGGAASTAGTSAGTVQELADLLTGAGRTSSSSTASGCSTARAARTRRARC